MSFTVNTNVGAMAALQSLNQTNKNLSITLADHNVAHILSTRAWLTGLQNAGVIESAAEIIGRIGQHGRNLSPLQVDRAVQAKGDKSDWLQAAIAAQRGLGH